MCPERDTGRRGALRWARLGLRARVTVTFALGALILSVSMGALSYFTARHFLLSERESASVSTAIHNAQLVTGDLHHTITPTTVLLAADSGTIRSRSVLEWKGAWYGHPLSVGPLEIPGGLRALVNAQVPASQTVLQDKIPEIIVGIPLSPAVHGAYYEIFDIGDLSHTLAVLSLALFVAGLVTTLLGAVLGRWASGRALRPLAGVSRAAVAIAGGELGTRLSAEGRDPDLAALTRSFNQMVDHLEERIEREARFTSDVSHELRSPLTTLAASLEVLESQVADLSPAGRQALALLGDDLRRFQRMVGDLLEISRSSAGSADASFEEVDPGELVRRAVLNARRALPVGSVVPRVEVDPRVADTRLSVDKRRFERVMTNLLENAALYGGGARAVRVGPAEPGEGHLRAVRVSVDDAGPGLPESERSKIFERFYRGHTAYKRGAGTGTGLGLALVAEHVRLHGGKVWVEDAPEGGARFTIELPGDVADDGDEGDDGDGGDDGIGSDPGARLAQPAPPLPEGAS